MQRARVGRARGGALRRHVATRFAPGTLLAERYRVVSPLGRGGMGEVFRAQDLKLGEEVALKLLPEQVEQDSSKLERLFGEARIARRVTHPNVCRVHDVGTYETRDGPRHFLSMEYIAGEDLDSLLRRIGRLSQPKALEVSIELCAGLAAVHAVGLLHRDIKPHNVMLDHAGRIRLTDFGLAAWGRAQTSGGGTPAYMAPEQHTSGASTVRTDIYALGLVLYELFTGERAFRARSPEEYAQLHQDREPLPPSRHHHSLDPALERILLRCLEKVAERRPTSVESVAGALAEVDPRGLVDPGEADGGGHQEASTWVDGQPPFAHDEVVARAAPTPTVATSSTGAPPRGTRGAPLVLIYAHTVDRPQIVAVRDFLQQQGLRTEEVENVPLQPIQLRRQALERAAALLIVHCEVEGRWVEARFNEAIRIVTEQRRPFVFSVYLGAPAGKDLSVYDAFRCYNFYLLDHRDGFRPEAFDPLLSSLRRDPAVPTQLPECPFLGLRSFGSEESSLFHGRDGQVQELLEQFHRTRFVALLGNSGCGKSSLVRAGLIPALEAGWLVAERDRWQVASLRPGSRPIESLVTAVVPPPRDRSPLGAQMPRLLEGDAQPLLDTLAPVLDGRTNLLVLVDQFEELFRFGLQGDTAHRREAEALVALLLELARGPLQIYVLLVLRSDFLGDCDKIEGLPEALSRNQFLVPRLTRHERRAAIEGPIQRYGRKIDPELVDRLLDEVGESSDQLPLMQHVLMRTWDRANGEETLSLEHYDAVGSLAKALSCHADEATLSLSDEDQRLAEWVFRALVDIDTEGRRVRRPRTVAQLVEETGGNLAAIEGILEAFRRPDRAFLMPPSQISLTEETLVDISHESLIRQWDRLREWVDREDELAAIYRRLDERASAFGRDGRNPLVDRELEEALEWSEKTRPDDRRLERYGGDTRALRDYIAASRQLDEQRRRDEARRSEELEDARRREAQALRDKARQARRLNRFFSGALLLALVLTSWSLSQRQEAKLQSERAQRKTSEASYRLAQVYEERAVAAATAARELDEPEQYANSWLYSLRALAESGGERPLRASMSRLFEPDLRSQVFQQAWRSPRAPDQVSLAFGPDGRHLAAGAEDGSIRLWDLDSGKHVATFEGHSDRVHGVVFQVDGNHLASGSADGTVRLWDLDSGQNVQTLEAQNLGPLTFSPDGRRLAFGIEKGQNRIWDPATGRTITTLESYEEEIGNLAFSSDGSRLIAAYRDHTTQLWDPETGQSLAVLEGLSEPFLGAAISRSGHQLAFVSSEGQIRLRGLESGRHFTTLGHLPEEDPLEDYYPEMRTARLTFSPDESQLISSDRGEIRLWDLQTGRDRILATGSRPWIDSLQFSPDGGLLAIASRGSIQLWDVARDRTLASLEGHPLSIESLAFHPEGRLLASGSHDATIHLWDLDTGRGLAVLEGHSDSIREVAFSPDGRHLASASEDNTLRLWDLETYDSVTFEGHTSFTSVAFSPDGRLLASGSQDGTARFWSTTTGQSLRVLQAHQGLVASVAFSPDGRHLASGGRDPEIRIWDVDSGRSIATLEGHTGPVSSVTFSPWGHYLASGSWDNTARIWDLETGQCIITREDPTYGVTRVAFDPTGRYFAYGALNEFKLWDLDSNRDPRTFQSSALDLAFSPDGQHLATVSGRRILRLWNLENEASTLSLSSTDQQPIHEAAFSPEGRYLAESRGRGWVGTWDLQENRRTATLRGSANGPSEIGWSPDGQHLAMAMGLMGIRIWTLANTEEGQGPVLTPLQGSGIRWYSGIAFSPDSQQVASGSTDDTVQIWDLETGQSVATLEGHSDQIRSLAFHPGERYLASGSDDHTLRLWDLDTGQSVVTLEGHGGAISSVAFAPDGRQLASGSEDHTIRVWDSETWQSTRTLEGHRGPVWSVAFAPDGRQLASGSDDNTVRIWDLEAGRERATLEGHQADVRSVTFGNEGRLLASGSDDRTIRIWDLRTGQSIAVLEGHSAAVYGLAFRPGTNQLASRAEAIRLWDPNTWQTYDILDGDPEHFSSLALSHGGSRVAAGTDSSRIWFWEPETQPSRVRFLAGHSDGISSLVFHPDGRRLVSGSEDTTIRIWDLEDTLDSEPLEGHLAAVTSLAFDAKGQRLASGSSDRTVRVWDFETGQGIVTLEGSSAPVVSLAFDPGGPRLATVSGDAIWLWDLETGQHLTTLGDPASDLVAFSPDGRYLTSGSVDGSIQVWDSRTYETVVALEGHPENVSSLGFQSEGERLVSLGTDGLVRYWVFRFPATLIDPSSRPEVFEGLFRASVEVLARRLEPGLTPVNDYRFPSTYELPRSERPRPMDRDVLEWLMEIAEDLPPADPLAPRGWRETYEIPRAEQVGPADRNTVGSLENAVEEFLLENPSASFDRQE